MKKESAVTLVVMLVCAITITLVALHHEPWFDEAQGWLLARDSGFTELLFHHLRYEGSPGLWHLLLWPFARSGFPYGTMQVLACIAALTATFLLLRYSPFPLWMRILLPFSFYLGYQYAVVARSYVLLPPILFAIAACYPQRLKRPVAYFILLALLANISAHTLLMALALAAFHLWDRFAARREMEQGELKRTLIVYAAFGVLLIAMAAMLWPPSDLKVFTGDRNRDWLRSVTYPLTDFTVLSVLLYAGSLIVFWKRRVLVLFLVMWGSIALLFARVFRYTHDGLLFLVWLFCMWLALNVETEESEAPLFDRISVRQLATALIAVVLVFHLAWTGMTVHRDWTANYSASREAAAFLKENGAEHKRVWGWGFSIMSILPYFDDNIFMNYNGGTRPCFWLWRRENPWNRQVGTRKTDFSRELAELQHVKPDLVVIAIKNKAQGAFAIQLDQSPDYRMAAFVRGRLVYKTVETPEIEDYCLFVRTVP